jgi:hypothetical protein
LLEHNHHQHQSMLYKRKYISAISLTHRTILNDYVNIQLGGEAPSCIQLSIFFPLVLLYSLWVFLISNNDSLK